MAEDAEFGLRKTIVILAIVAGCFAILWPKIFHPMTNTPVSTVHGTPGPGPLRQERTTPPRAGGGPHPAVREGGRTVPPHLKVHGRPEHMGIQKMRPPLGASGRVVATPGDSSSMGIFMPLYTVGIIIFFIYTVAKVMRKNDDNVIYAEYENPAAEREYRDRVFHPDVLNIALTGLPHDRKEQRCASPKKLVPTPTIEQLKEQAAGDIEIDQLRQRLVDTEAAMERIVEQMNSLSRNTS